MTDFWVSTPKHWCEYCEIFVTNNPSQRKRHDTGPKHIRNVERSMQRKRAERMRVSAASAPRGGSQGPGDWRRKAAPEPDAPAAAVLEPVAAGEQQEHEQDPAERALPAPDPTANYDPANPYGAWVQASPPRPAAASDDSSEGGQPANKRQAIEDGDEQWADEEIEDALSDFEIKPLEAPARRLTEEEKMVRELEGRGGGGDDDDAEGGDGGDAAVPVFKPKARAKQRNARQKDKRDINDD